MDELEKLADGVGGLYHYWHQQGGIGGTPKWHNEQEHTCGSHRGCVGDTPDDWRRWIRTKHTQRVNIGLAAYLAGVRQEHWYRTYVEIDTGIPEVRERHHFIRGRLSQVRDIGTLRDIVTKTEGDDGVGD